MIRINRGKVDVQIGNQWQVVRRDAGQAAGRDVDRLDDDAVADEDMVDPRDRKTPEEGASLRLRWLAQIDIPEPRTEPAAGRCMGQGVEVAAEQNRIAAGWIG